MHWAFGLPFLGLLFDFLDGKVARLTKNGPSLLGQELDSLSDLISFGVAPAILGYVVGLRTRLDTLILAFFVCAGLARLARFNVTTHVIPQDENGKAKYFDGLPIPTSLFLVALLWYAFQYNHLNQVMVILTLYKNTKVHLFSFAYLGWAFAMVSKTLKIPKL